MIEYAKLVRTALQDAASVASILITPSAAVADAPRKSSGGGAGGMGGMDFQEVRSPSSDRNEEGWSGNGLAIYFGLVHRSTTEADPKLLAADQWL